jgi:hypothetical protein
VAREVSLNADDAVPDSHDIGKSDDIIRNGGIHMRKTFVGLSVVLGAFLGLYGALSLHEVISGEFKWERPFSFWTAIAAVYIFLLIANAGFHLRQQHRNVYGLIQIAIGCVILLSQFAGPASSDPMISAKFLAALFFVVQGFEAWRATRQVGTSAAR